jgi:RNA methyltransferase, TrmH family
MDLISSRSNPRLKFLRSIRQRKGREATGLFIVEGIRHVGEAVEAGIKLDGLYYAPELLSSDFAASLVAQQSAEGVPCFALTAAAFESVADKENPQGLLAVAHLPQRPLTDFNPQNFRWGAALVSPQDPGNVGAILRTIDAVGASGLLLLEESVEIGHPTLVRASMGSLFWKPVIQASFANFQGWAKKHGYSVIGTSAHAAQDYRELRAHKPPLILLLGSERAGLTPDQSAACSSMVRLPMHGRATSLNLAVAAGVLLYTIQEAASS